ncbi:putative fructokinase-7 [Artemisia annua]|uniref:Putative fructokinase-7 n=1 Tax=Artemisia annua TaxID=35608 RepID=A0A2U1PZ79_ARTAN|nr:putative fructokinase-7 [Artemisia annua]
MSFAKKSGIILSYDFNLRPELWRSADATCEGIMSIWDHADVNKVNEASNRFKLFMQPIINSNELGILNLLIIEVLQQNGTGQLSNVDLHCGFCIELSTTCLSIANAYLLIEKNFLVEPYRIGSKLMQLLILIVFASYGFENVGSWAAQLPEKKRLCN